MTTATATTIPDVVRAIAAFWGGTDEVTETATRTWRFGSRENGRYQVWGPGVSAKLAEESGRPFSKRVPAKTYIVRPLDDAPSWWEVAADGATWSYSKGEFNVLDEWTPPAPPVPEPTTLVEAQARYDELADELDAGYEALSEIEGQYRSEVAAFGDAWPGAAIQVADIKAALAATEAAREALTVAWPALLPPPPAPPVPGVPGLEEPF